jgi:hypothetical protein
MLRRSSAPTAPEAARDGAIAEAAETVAGHSRADFAERQLVSS